MRQYELMVVLAPDIPEDQMPAALDRVSGYITGTNGEIAELNTTSHNSLTLGRRRLAYPINKHRDGYYALYHFNIEPSGIAELERELHLNTQVLRHLVTSYAPPKPRPPKKPRGESAAATAAPTVEATGVPLEVMAPVSMAEAEAAEPAPVTSASGATMDVDTPVPPGPAGEDNDEPPTAETPEVDE